MSRYHVCVRKQALHFGTERLEEALELATHLQRKGCEVEIVDNATGRDVDLPTLAEDQSLKRAAGV